MKNPLQAIVVVCCVAAGALAGYWAWTYEGLYRWLAEWQLRTFGSYEAQLTLIFTGLILIAPIAAVGAILRRLRRGDLAPFDATPATPAIARSTAIQLWLGRWWGALVAAGVGIGLAAPGVYYLHRGRTAGDVTRVTAADIDAGRVPARHWVAVSGDAVVEQAVSISKSSGGNATFYVPVISENYDPARGVTLFLKARADDIDDDVRRFGDGRFEGMLTRASLPGMVRVEFERRQTQPAKGYCILELGRMPADDIRVGRDMLIFGGAFLVGAVGLVGWQLWQARREGPAEQVAPAPAAATQAMAAPLSPAAKPARDPRFQVKAILPLGTKPPQDSTGDEH